MDERLVDYLRNTLDPATRRAVEAYLRSDPDAAARMRLLRQTLAPWDDAGMPAPPPDLVQRTLARVAEYRRRPLPPAPAPRPREFGAAGPRRFRPADVLVAAVVLLLAGAVAFAWLPSSRQRANQLACQNKMRVLWHALDQYSDSPENHGEFPRVEADGPRGVAGVFAPVLQDAGLLPPDTTLVCSANGDPAPPRPGVRDLEQLYRDQPAMFKSVARTLAGTYAYTLGYNDNGSLRGLRRDSGDLLPLLADAPPATGTGLSPNHGGRGQNVLYIGGNVRWCTERTVGVNRDDIYLNQDGVLRTGRNWGDTVLAPSGATPFGSGP